MKLPLIIRQWRWEIVEQLLRWGIYGKEGEKWIKNQLRKLSLKIGLIL